MFTGMVCRGGICTGAIALLASSALGTAYVKTDLVTSAGDSQLINPWGIATSPTSPFWIADNGTGLSTLYNSAGTKQGLVVTITGGLPTGVVFNGTTSFNGDAFLFSSEGGTVTGWRGALGTTAETLSIGAPGSVYKGLALSTAKNVIYLADFGNSQVANVLDSGAPSLTGTFTDPTLPAGYAPFNVALLAGKVYVAYAVKDSGTGDETAGAGLGIVDTFDENGNFLSRLISPGGALNAPWGMTIAPTGFGDLSGDLLVGNFGDGRINAFDPSTGTYLGTLSDAAATPIAIDGLWGLLFGNGGNGGDAHTLYFTAGPNGETAGEFGAISVVPEPTSLAILAVGGIGLVSRRRRAKG